MADQKPKKSKMHSGTETLANIKSEMGTKIHDTASHPQDRMT
jgi:hypothetical protein